MKSLVTISGFSGSGKTSLTDALATNLKDALVLKFDELDSLMVWSDDYPEWLAQGADYEAFNLDRMRAHVDQTIKESHARCVIFDYPNGKLHSAFKDVIDLAVYVDTPLDIAMARRLLRDLPNEHSAAQEWLKEELQAYLVAGRNAYLEMDKQVKPSCDLLVDGTRPIDELVSIILQEMKTRKLLFV
jgi:uridine kinase